jgi:hypothetical protein
MEDYKIKGDMLPVEVDIKHKNIIFNYIKKNNKTVGVLLACKFNKSDEIFIGWSKCHKDDIFDIQTTFDIAIFRAYANYISEDNVLTYTDEDLP